MYQNISILLVCLLTLNLAHSNEEGLVQKNDQAFYELLKDK